MSRTQAPRDQASKLRDLARLDRSRASCDCPACGERKPAGFAVCPGCSAMLPSGHRESLLARAIDARYAAAFYNATCYLSARGIYHPTEIFTRPDHPSQEA